MATDQPAPTGGAPGSAAQPAHVGAASAALYRLLPEPIAAYHAQLDAALQACGQRLVSDPGEQLDALHKRLTCARNLLYYSEPAQRLVLAEFKRQAVDCAEQEREILAALPPLVRTADDARALLTALEAASEAAIGGAQPSKRQSVVSANPVNAARLCSLQCDYEISQALDGAAAAASAGAAFAYAAQAFELLMAYADMVVTMLTRGGALAPQFPRVYLPAVARPHAPTWINEAGEIPADLVQRSVLARSIDYDALFAECHSLIQGAAQPEACIT